MRKLIAIGDLHGSIDSLVEIVQRLGIVDGKLDLALEEGDLIFMGDLCDRGTNSRGLYELVMRWQAGAARVRSTVTFLLGNHEVMNTYGLGHYNTPEEYLSFDAASLAAGRRAHAEAFRAGGWLYRWLTAQRAIVKIGSLVFAHGDFPSELVDWSIEEINERVMGTYRGAPADASSRDLPDPLFAPERSVLWCREAQVERPRDYGRRLAAFLERNGASAWVCGHTPAEDGSFHLLYGGRYLCVDTAMTFERFGTGRKSALLVENGRAVAAYLERGELLARALELRLDPGAAGGASAGGGLRASNKPAESDASGSAP